MAMAIQKYSMAPRQLAEGKHHNSLGPLTKPDIAMCPVYNIRDITMWPHLLVDALEVSWSVSDINTSLPYTSAQST